MTHLKFTTLLLSCLLVAACGSDDSKQDATKEITTIEPAAIELGTAVKDVVKSTASDKNSDFEELSWEELVPPDFKPEVIMAKYQAQIQEAKEGSEEERVLFEKVMAEFNSAGSNTELNGKIVRIPGFVAPLDIDGENVVDFLLVPYYGSCIHSPPPPANQTIMVNPAVGKSITLNQTYRPVWVVGELAAEEIDTDLAKAGYQIKNAHVEPYTQPVN